MRDRQNCIDCGKQSPETETNYTLISAQFGWRLSRRRDRNGDFIVEWRCAECWRDHKKKTDAEALAGGPAKPIGEKADAPRRPVPPPVLPRSPASAASHASSRPPSRPSSKPAPSRPPSQAPNSAAGESERPRAIPALPRPPRRP
jgi:hypothetical protein